MSGSEPCAQVVLQRVRNQIIGLLETFSSYDEQREYAQNVSVAYVPYELPNSWDDFVDESWPAQFTDPVFTEEERRAIAVFNAQLVAVSEAMPDTYLRLEKFLAAPYWIALREAAVNALLSFRQRGRLAED